MKRAFAVTIAALCLGGTTFAGETHHAGVPTLNTQAQTRVAFEGNTMTLTFGPIDLPSSRPCLRRMGACSRTTTSTISS